MARNTKKEENIMNNIDIENKIDMLDKIYTARQYDFQKKANLDRKELAEKLNNITIEEVEAVIKENMEEQYQKQELIEKLDKLVENYEIKMAYYMEKGYKQGFKDGVNLLKQCDENR